MSRKHIGFGSAVALLVALLLHATVAGAETDKASQDAKAKLEALKKRLPKLIDSGLQDTWRVQIEAKRIKVRVARLTAPTQAKIILLVEGPPDSSLKEEWVLTFQLRYYEGAWTTMKCEGNLPGLEKVKPFLELAIDDAEGK